MLDARDVDQIRKEAELEGNCAVSNPGPVTPITPDKQPEAERDTQHAAQDDEHFDARYQAEREAEVLYQEALDAEEYKRLEALHQEQLDAHRKAELEAQHYDKQLKELEAQLNKPSNEKITPTVTTCGQRMAESYMHDHLDHGAFSSKTGHRRKDPRRGGKRGTKCHYRNPSEGNRHEVRTHAKTKSQKDIQEILEYLR